MSTNPDNDQKRASLQEQTLSRFHDLKQNMNQRIRKLSQRLSRLPNHLNENLYGVHIIEE